VLREETQRKRRQIATICPNLAKPSPMPDKRMLLLDNIGELSRHSRLTIEVPFFNLDLNDCDLGVLTPVGTFVRNRCTSKPAVSEQDAIQMIRQGCKRSARRAPAGMCEVRYLAVAILAAVTAACATLSPTSPTEEKVKVVTERAAARWKAIIGKDFASAYDYMSPPSRATVTPAGFKTIASRLDYKDAQIIGVTCEAEVCNVRLLITFDTKQMKGVHSPLEESWLIDKGQAWYVWLL
jgi:hypothetical protein